MACHHIGLELFAQTEGTDNAVEEDGGLRHLRLLQFLVSAFKHNVRDAKTEDIIGLFKKFLGGGVLLVQVLAHTYKLCALTGKYKCFHGLVIRVLRS